MKNEIIEIKEEVQIGDVVLEEGDRIRILNEFKDHRDIFKSEVMRKTDFDEAHEDFEDYIRLNNKQKMAIKDIASSGNIIAVNSNVSAFDPIFKERSGIEWIVLHEEYGYFYVNNEGYNYARYLFPIPNNVVSDIDLDNYEVLHTYNL